LNPQTHSYTFNQHQICAEVSVLQDDASKTLVMLTSDRLVTS